MPYEARIESRTEAGACWFSALSLTAGAYNAALNVLYLLDSPACGGAADGAGCAGVMVRGIRCRRSLRDRRSRASVRVAMHVAGAHKGRAHFWRSPIRSAQAVGRGGG